MSPTGDHGGSDDGWPGDRRGDVRQKYICTWLAGRSLLDPSRARGRPQSILAYIRLAVVANVLSIFTFGLVAMVMLPLSAAQVGYTAMSP